MKKVWYLVSLVILALIIIAASPSMLIKKSAVRTSQGSIVSATNASGVTVGGWLYGVFIDSSGLTTTYTLDLYDHKSGVTVMSTRIIPPIVIVSGVSSVFTHIRFDPPINFDSGISTVVTNAGALKNYQIYYITR